MMTPALAAARICCASACARIEMVSGRAVTHSRQSVAGRDPVGPLRTFCCGLNVADRLGVRRLRLGRVARPDDGRDRALAAACLGSGLRRNDGLGGWRDGAHGTTPDVGA